MQRKEIEDRLTSLMLRLGSGASDDTDALLKDIRELETVLQSDDVKAALSEGERTDMGNALGVFIETLETPSMMQHLADGLGGTYEPDPEICDAIDAGDVAAVKSVLETWDVNTLFGEYDKTALYHAMSGFDTDIAVINALLDAGADPRLGLGQSNVLHGLGFGQMRDLSPEALAQVVRRCVELGADLEQRTDHLQWTPLICAASEWNAVATEALLLAGADINARAGQVDGVFGAGETAAHFAKGCETTSAVLQRYVRPN